MPYIRSIITGALAGAIVAAGWSLGGIVNLPLPVTLRICLLGAAGLAIWLLLELRSALRRSTVISSFLLFYPIYLMSFFFSLIGFGLGLGLAGISH